MSNVRTTDQLIAMGDAILINGDHALYSLYALGNPLPVAGLLYMVRVRILPQGAREALPWEIVGMTATLDLAYKLAHEGTRWAHRDDD